jgi:hypothetical protein
MLKSHAISLLGGTPTAVAQAVRVSTSAVAQWPDQLSDRIADRVLAALARKHLPAEMLAGCFSDLPGQSAGGGDAV